MKDAKEALYCIGQMADKCLTSLGAIQKDYNEFASLVRRMREAQIEKDESDQGYRTIPHICILEKKDRLESEVDEYLKELNG